MKLGVESFTIITDFIEDFEGTLKKSRKLGLKYLEWLASVSVDDENYFGWPAHITPQEAVKTIEDNGMELTGAIFGIPNPKEGLFDLDKMQKIIDWYGKTGCSAIGLANDYFVDEEFFKRRMDVYNELGRRCKDAGMVWMYHNHFHEQQKIGDKTVLELMVELTDPETVGFDWDIYWGIRGMVDPVDNIKTLGKRISRFHCKDYPFNKLENINIAKKLPKELVGFDQEEHSAYVMVEPDDFIECGKGIIKWQDVIHAANEFDIPYMFVEQDYTTYDSKYDSLADSIKYLLSLDGLTVN